MVERSLNADSLAPLVANNLTARQRNVRRGLLALTLAWLAWLYWFSRAAILAMATLAIGLIVVLLVRASIRLLRAGGGVYRYLWLRLLLSLARRVV